MGATRVQDDQSQTRQKSKVTRDNKCGDTIVFHRGHCPLVR